MKNLMVFFLAIVGMFALVATVSAAEVMDFSNASTIVKVDGANTDGSIISVIAGDTITVRLYFDALEDASNIRVKASIEGDKVDVDERTESFDVINGSRYSKTLTLTIPSDLKDDLSEDLELFLKVWNGDLKDESSAIALSVQRPSYNTEIKSVSFSSTIDAGETLPVDVVLKNTGYNDLDDLYVTVSIPELDVSKTSYFGDLVALENSSNDDEEDTASGRLYLQVPYGAEAGVYTVEVTTSNDDMTTNFAKQIVVNNDFSAGEVIRNGESLLIVNPTNKLKVYNVVFPESESFVTVSAGTSKTIPISPSSDDYTVSVLSMNGEVISSFTFSDSVTEKTSSMSDPVVVLTVILAIVFVVLLIVLIVLIGKKPEKSEDFGESYY